MFGTWRCIPPSETPDSTLTLKFIVEMHCSMLIYENETKIRQQKGRQQAQDELDILSKRGIEEQLPVGLSGDERMNGFISFWY